MSWPRRWSPRGTRFAASNAAQKLARSGLFDMTSSSWSAQNSESVAPPSEAVDVFAGKDLAAIEASTREVGRHLFEQLCTLRPNVLERRWWDDHLMAWTMHDDAVKTQMFRFVDVLPALPDSASVTRHLREYLGEAEGALPAALRMGLSVATPGSLAGRALALAARRNVLAQARRFIAGATLDEVLVAAMRQRKLRRAFTIDLLGEAVLTDAEAEAYQAAYVLLLQNLGPVVNQWPAEPQLDAAALAHGVSVELPRVNVSLKLSSLDAQYDPLDWDGTVKRVSRRLRVILREAQRQRAFVNIDMEDYRTKNLALAIVCGVLDEAEFRPCADVGLVVQAYLRDSADDLASLAAWAQRRGTPIWVRLVKGAYWDYEVTTARAADWPVPVYLRKQETDANFERLARYLLANHLWLRPAIASHNIRSLAHAIATARHLGLAKTAFELQMLYGMGDEEKQALVELGHRVRVYMPYGPLVPGMSYLVRRLLENTSNTSFLRASQIEYAAPEDLLMNPLDLPARLQKADSPAASREASLGWRQAFHNEPATDFSHRDKQRLMLAALDDVSTQLGRFYPLVIGGEEVDTDTRLPSYNPSHQRQLVGVTGVADRRHVERAVAAAQAAAAEWRNFGAAGRAMYLRAAAQTMRQRRFELSSWIVFESGKGWREADADVAEAIDFCEFYAAGAVAMEQGPELAVPGEVNRYGFLPRGVTAVIAPWNFPLAILCGMTAAALATGNTVIMKPAEQAPVIGAQLMQVFRDVGLPAGVVNFLPGQGSVAGAALVEHPQAPLIVFTGSREVGLMIHARAAQVAEQTGPAVKRVIAEMGGKNAIVVDDDADLDEAVLGVLRSAFGYQGQKCSACSRVIVVAAAYQAFLGRLVEATRGLRLGPAEDPGTQVGPLIDADAVAKVQGYIALGRQEAREVLAVDSGELTGEGFYVGPHIFADVAPGSRLAQEEIFGPVLAVIRAGDFDEAIRIANGTQYALTAGIYSRSPAHLQQAAREILAGNLYLNRPITGALVNRQPFGGFRQSGIGSQAGGPDYLLQFVVPRTVTENTLRRGFAPPPADPASDEGAINSVKRRGARQ